MLLNLWFLSINLNVQRMNGMTHFDLEKLVRLYDTLGRT